MTDTAAYCPLAERPQPSFVSDSRWGWTPTPIAVAHRRRGRCRLDRDNSHTQTRTCVYIIIVVSIYCSFIQIKKSRERVTRKGWLIWFSFFVLVNHLSNWKWKPMSAHKYFFIYGMQISLPKGQIIVHQLI